jgi:hypothetical protein
MKKLCIAFTTGIILFLSVCSKQEYRIAMIFTCPQGKEVNFDGFYRVLSTGDSVSMVGYTPSTYTEILIEGDTLIGRFWKADSNYSDTLQFDFYVDLEPIIDKGYITSPFFPVDFQYPILE